MGLKVIWIIKENLKLCFHWSSLNMLASCQLFHTQLRLDSWVFPRWMILWPFRNPPGHHKMFFHRGSGFTLKPGAAVWEWLCHIHSCCFTRIYSETCISVTCYTSIHEWIQIKLENSRGCGKQELWHTGRCPDQEKKVFSSRFVSK